MVESPSTTTHGRALNDHHFPTLTPPRFLTMQKKAEVVAKVIPIVRKFSSNLFMSTCNCLDTFSTFFVLLLVVYVLSLFTTTTTTTQSMCSGSTSMPKFLFMNSYVVQQIAEAGMWKRTRAVAPENKARRPSRSATCLATLNALAEA